MNLLDMMSGSVLGALGCNMDTFLRYFPAAETMYTIFIALGMGFLLLNFVWQLFRNFGLGMGIEAEDPIKLTMRTVLFMLCTVFSSQIVNIALKIGGTPYQWIVSADLPPIQFASFMSVITPIIGSIVSGSVLLICLVVVVILAWNYLKLLFEAAERYILLGVLVFTAPVAVSMGGSQSTGNIFKSWCRMLGGQIFLLLMNAWCLKLFTSMFGEFLANPMDDGGNFFVWLLCAVGFLKVSQKVDSFMGTLGIGVGRTGGNMLGELMIAARAFSGSRKSGGAGAGGKATAAGASPSTGTAPSTGFMSGGLAGMVGRKVSNSAASNLAAEAGEEKGGVFAGLGSSMYNKSVGEAGGFAANVIGSVAKGRGTQITGDKAVDAFNAYMGNVSSSPGSSSGGSAVGAEIPISPDGGINAGNTGTGTGSPVDDVLDTMPPADIPMDSGEIPMDSDAIPMDSGDDAFGGDSIDPAALEPLQPIPEGADYFDGIPGESPTETSGVFSGAGPSAYGDNGDSAIAAVEAEAQMSRTPIPSEQYGAEASGSADGAGCSILSGADAVFGETLKSDGGVTIDTHTPIPEGSGGASNEIAASGSGDGFAGGISSGIDSTVSETFVSDTGATVTTHAPIPTGVGYSGSPGEGSNQIPSSGSADSGTVVTGADSVTAGGTTIPLGGGSGIGNSPGNSTSGASGNGYQSDSYAEGVHSTAFSNNYGNGKSSPYSEPSTYRDVTMGGGRITGVEVSPTNPGGIQFAMYHANQYTKPEGEYTTVKSLDGAKWYKQYAAPAVERTPIKEKNGKVEYREKIVKKLPKGPTRIDRI